AGERWPVARSLANAIHCPSGDHTGAAFRYLPPVRRTKPEPSASIRQMSNRSPTSPAAWHAKTIFDPSGDQWGVATVLPPTTRRNPDPSRFWTQSWLGGEVRSREVGTSGSPVNTNARPSGDQSIACQAPASDTYSALEFPVRLVTARTSVTFPPSRLDLARYAICVPSG